VNDVEKRWREQHIKKTTTVEKRRRRRKKIIGLHAHNVVLH
jgi:hypothetical protein